MAEVETVGIRIGAAQRRLLIVDNLVAPDAVRSIFDRLRVLPYTFNDSDREDTGDYKHFKHDFAIGRDVDPVIDLLAGRARAVLRAAGVECGALDRVYANLNLFGDFQFAHDDGDGWTALLFVNSEWHEDWGGEFFAYTDEAARYAYAILPRPGRMLIFDGLIRHRGGVPSKFCHEPRISLAIKFER